MRGMKRSREIFMMRRRLNDLFCEISSATRFSPQRHHPMNNERGWRSENFSSISQTFAVHPSSIQRFSALLSTHLLYYVSQWSDNYSIVFFFPPTCFQLFRGLPHRSFVATAKWWGRKLFRCHVKSEPFFSRRRRGLLRGEKLSDSMSLHPYCLYTSDNNKNKPTYIAPSSVRIKLL